MKIPCVTDANTWEVVFNMGMMYQSDGKDLTKLTEYFVGGVKPECHCLKDWF